MITQINSALIGLLTSSLADILPKPGQVGLCSLDKPGGIILGLYLYNIRPCNEVSVPPVFLKGRSVKEIPPKFLTLHYLITVFGKAEAEFRVMEEHRILTRAMQAFEYTPNLTEQSLGFKPYWTEDIKLMPVELDFSEISQIWERQGSHYRLSAAYKVCPVELPNLSSDVISRVTGTDFKGVEL